MKHTKGKWSVKQPINLDGTPCHETFINTEKQSICEMNRHNPQLKANAKLIAEAGTVANETGFTPRQLADQKAELLEEIEEKYLKLQLFANKVIDSAVRSDETRARLRNLIAKVKGITPQEVQEACEMKAIEKAKIQAHGI